jgi:hypothetical protein
MHDNICFAGNKEPFDRVDEAAIYGALQVFAVFSARKYVAKQYRHAFVVCI